MIVRYWYPWSGPAGDMMRKLVDEFNLSNQWQIVVIPVQQDSLDEMDSNVSAAIAANDTPDLVVGYAHQLLPAPGILVFYIPCLG